MKSVDMSRHAGWYGAFLGPKSHMLFCSTDGHCMQEVARLVTAGQLNGWQKVFLRGALWVILCLCDTATSSLMLSLEQTVLLLCTHVGDVFRSSMMGNYCITCYHTVQVSLPVWACFCRMWALLDSGPCLPYWYCSSEPCCRWRLDRLFLMLLSRAWCMCCHYQKPCLFDELAVSASSSNKHQVQYVVLEGSSICRNNAIRAEKLSW